MDFTVNLSGVHPDVARGIVTHLRHEDRARHALGLVEQRRLKQAHDQVVGPGFNTNIGRQNMVLSQDQWRRFMQLYGQLCWSDPEFSKWVLKQDQHADLRVKDVGTRIQSGFTGKGDSRRG